MARKRYKPEEIVAKLRQVMFWSCCRAMGSSQPMPAVDGINGKIAGYGGAR